MIELFPYQKIGVDFFKSRNHALLADEMGLGKSAQAIRASLTLKNILVICPASAKINWQREFWKFANRKTHIAGGSDASAASDMRRVGVIICSYEYATKLKNSYAKTYWHLVVVDESHYLKEPTAERTKAIFGKEGLIHSSKRMWLLSGTPAPNHAGELWTMLCVFGYTKLSYDGFTARYCNSHRHGNRYARIQITGSNTKHTPELKKLLKKVVLRRLKKDVLPDLPPIFHTVHYIEDDGSDPFENLPDLREKMRAEYARLSDIIDFGPDLSDEKLLPMLSVMSQSISALRRYHGLKKVKPIAELIKQELALGLYDKIVVFGIHKDVLGSLTECDLWEFNPVIVTGSTPTQVRQRSIDFFQNDPSCKIFIGNIQAAGIAINLTAANQVLFIEQDWVPGNNQQAAMRCHRIGQERAVTVRHACIANSFDDRVTAILTRKIQELSTFI